MENKTIVPFIVSITSVYEPLYTLTEAEKIIDLQRARKNRNRKRARVYFIKQKSCGVLMVALAYVIAVIELEWLLSFAL